jgi:hypothetical protein
MRKTHWSVKTGAAILLFTLPVQSGCTVLGYGLGSLIDRQSPSIEEVPLGAGLSELDAGDRVTCVTKENGEVAGEFVGLGVPSKSTLRELLPPAPPGDCAQRESVRLGDLLVMKRKGLDADTVVYASTDRERLYYQLSSGEAVQALLFMHIERLTRCGGREIPPPYAKRTDEGLFERVVQFRLLTEGRMVDIDTSTIRSLLFERTPSTARVVLGIAGLAVDAVLITTLVLGNIFVNTLFQLAKD